MTRWIWWGSKNTTKYNLSIIQVPSLLRGIRVCSVILVIPNICNPVKNHVESHISLLARLISTLDMFSLMSFTWAKPLQFVWIKHQTAKQIHIYIHTYTHTHIYINMRYKDSEDLLVIVGTIKKKFLKHQNQIIVLFSKLSTHTIRINDSYTKWSTSWYIPKTLRQPQNSRYFYFILFCFCSKLREFSEKMSRENQAKWSRKNETIRWRRRRGYVGYKQDSGGE